MIDEQDEDQTILFMNRNSQRKRLRTENVCVDKYEQKFVSKWEGNTFYHDIKRKIHQKLKTQPASENIGLGLFKNKKINIHNSTAFHKPKSKITISTLQIAIDPLQRKIQPTFQIQRKIYHKVESSISMIKTKPTKISRNMSAKLVRDPPPALTNSSRSLQKKELAQTCRKNSKVQTILEIKKSSKPYILDQQKPKQKPKFLSKQIQEQNSFFHLVQNKESIQMNRLIKSRSQTSKQSNSLVKMQTFDTDPLLFYFKVKNTFKPANRQISIKKLRTRIKTNNAFLGAL